MRMYLHYLGHRELFEIDVFDFPQLANVIYAGRARQELHLLHLRPPNGIVPSGAVPHVLLVKRFIRHPSVVIVTSLELSW